MHTEYGTTLSAGQFQSPFNAVVEELVQKGYLLYESFRDLMGPQWKNRLLEILIVDNPVLDAGAMEHAGRDRICISRGALEYIYGNILGLCSMPKFLPAIGNVGVEVAPKTPLPGGFPPVPLLRNLSSIPSRTQLFIPKDQTRIDLAETLVELALRFLIFHELGHILAGHLEMRGTIGMSALISEVEQPDDRSEAPGLWHVLECDADAFATHVTWWVHIHDKTVEILSKPLNAVELRRKDLILLTYLMTIGALFRILYPTDPVRITEYKGRQGQDMLLSSLQAQVGI